mmetsp:Transcript_489/g.978  ORF Transcript_489/g.978 Transcript_489/m.978 type:complete len:267 (-) Transcript_489:1804-2604(-)
MSLSSLRRVRHSCMPLALATYRQCRVSSMTSSNPSSAPLFGPRRLISPMISPASDRMRTRAGAPKQARVQRWPRPHRWPLRCSGLRMRRVRERAGLCTPPAQLRVAVLQIRSHHCAARGYQRMQHGASALMARSPPSVSPCSAAAAQCAAAAPIGGDSRISCLYLPSMISTRTHGQHSPQRSVSPLTTASLASCSLRAAAITMRCASSATVTLTRSLVRPRDALRWQWRSRTLAVGGLRPPSSSPKKPAARPPRARRSVGCRSEVL